MAFSVDSICNFGKIKPELIDKRIFLITKHKVDPVQKINSPQKPEAQEAIPSARRLITSLRDLGYDFASAVADLIDNSIEANATLVQIDVQFDGDNSSVRIADNGKGMSLEQLKEAMRYGSEREYSIEDLGKFGLGLKTASLSQCRKFSVASRVDKRKNEVSAYSWDLDYIEKENRWEIVRPSKNAIKIITGHHLDTHTGTVVYWQRLDRMLGYQYPYGETAKKNLSKLCRELEQHLGMVFHRFLAGEVPGRELKITLNGNEIQPWDPFARSEAQTKKLPPKIIRFSVEGVEGNIVIEPYVLPNQSGFSSLDAFNRASGPANWNQQQGFYIYRADRLIQSGGWSKMRTLDEHIKLARVALRFNPNLDAAFKINVAKMRVQLPIQVRSEIATIITMVTKVAQDVYRNSGQKSTNPSPKEELPILSPSLPESHQYAQPLPEKTFAQDIPLITNPCSDMKAGRTEIIDRTQASIIISPENQIQDNHGSIVWSLFDLEKRLMEIAEPDEKPILQKVFIRLRNRIDS